MGRVKAEGPLKLAVPRGALFGGTLDVLDAAGIDTAELRGDSRSLMCHNASTTHYSVSAEAREEMGVSEGMLRLNVDAGDAFSTRFSVNVGVGAGVRWRSPLGPVRVDIGFPVQTDLPTETSWRLHVLLGPDI